MLQEPSVVALGTVEPLRHKARGLALQSARDGDILGLTGRPARHRQHDRLINGQNTSFARDDSVDKGTKIFILPHGHTPAKIGFGSDAREIVSAPESRSGISLQEPEQE
jgi:hypothetical protein